MSFRRINEEASEAFEELIDNVREVQSLVMITAKLAREQAREEGEERPSQIAVLLKQIELILSSLEGDNTGIFSRWRSAYEAKKCRDIGALSRKSRRQRVIAETPQAVVAHRILRRPKSKARR